jgi:uncharacterized membrane protein
MIPAFLIGIAAGCRTMAAPTAVSWAATLGWIDLSASALAFLGYAATAWILTALAVMELVVDQLPTTPSRTVPPAFAARLITGTLSGAAVGIVIGSLALGIGAAIGGTVVGTFGGRRVRGWLAGLFGNDHPAALLEDAAVIALAYFVVSSL